MLCLSQSKQSSFRNLFIISRKFHHFSMRCEISMTRALDDASSRWRELSMMRALDSVDESRVSLWSKNEWDIRHINDEKIWSSANDWLIDWFIHSPFWHRICRPHAGLSTSVYIGKPFGEKKPISFVPHRLRFEALSISFDVYQFDVFFRSLFYYTLICLFSDRYLTRSENVRELMWIEIKFSISLLIEWAFLALLQC